MPFPNRSVRQFLRDRRGNYAMMMSVLSLPLLAAVGLAVDYTNMSSSRSELQNASDAAVLFASRQFQSTGAMPGDEQIRDFLAANFAGDVTAVAVSIAGGNIVVDATTPGRLYVFGMFEDYAPAVSVRSAAPVAKNTILEVALSLDTTYSMLADDKIGGLKNAATAFVDDVMGMNSAQNTVKIGVVPFSNYVNVGLHNRDKPWLSVPPDSVQTIPERCEERAEVIDWVNCRWETRYADGVPYQENVCDPVYGAKSMVCEPERTEEVKWWGCVGDREAPLTLLDRDPDVPFPGMMDSWNMLTWSCPTPIQPLSTNKAEVLASVDALTPRGETYIVDGVLWGTRLLSPDEPFSEGADPGKTSAEVKKVMVLMSDGDNTMSSELPDWYGHWGNDGPKSDVWTKDACKAARNDGIELFTITFGKAVSARGKDVMEKCASDADHYFDAANSSALSKAFREIAGRLMRVRLTM